MSDEPFDLTPLDPTRDQRFNERVRSIVRTGMRARRTSVPAVIASWALPALAAATLVAAVPLTVLVSRPPSQRVPTTAEILGIPSALVQLVARTPRPSIEDLAEALGTGGVHGR